MTTLIKLIGVSIVAYLLVSCDNRRMDSTPKILSKSSGGQDAKAQLAQVSNDVRRVGCTSDTFLAGYFNSEDPFESSSSQNGITDFDKTSAKNFMGLLSLLYRNNKCQETASNYTEQSTVLFAAIDFHGDHNSLLLTFHFGWDEQEANPQWRVLDADCWATDSKIETLSPLAQQSQCQKIKDSIYKYLRQPSEGNLEAFIKVSKTTKGLHELHSSQLKDLLASSKQQMAEKYDFCQKSTESTTCKFHHSVYILQGHGVPMAEPLKIKTVDRAQRSYTFGPILEYFSFGKGHHMMKRQDGSTTLLNRRVMFPDGYPKQDDAPVVQAGRYDSCELKSRVCPYYRLSELRGCISTKGLLARNVSSCFLWDIEDLRKDSKAARNAFDFTNQACLESITNDDIIFRNPRCIKVVNFYREKCLDLDHLQCEPYQPEDHSLLGQ